MKRRLLVTLTDGIQLIIAGAGQFDATRFGQASHGTLAYCLVGGRIFHVVRNVASVECVEGKESRAELRQQLAEAEDALKVCYDAPYKAESKHAALRSALSALEQKWRKANIVGAAEVADNLATLLRETGTEQP